MNKHQQKTAMTRRKLLAAAQRVFARHGFEAAHIDDIASEAGHTRGAFYANFKSKEDLFFALLEQHAAKNIDKLRSSLEGCSGDEKKLQLLREYYVKRSTDRQWSILVLEFKLYALRHGRLRAKLALAYRRIRAKIKLGDIRCFLPTSFQSGDEAYDLRRAALEGILHGLTVERAYDSEAISEPQIEFLLGELFDAVVAMRKPKEERSEGLGSFGKNS